MDACRTPSEQRHYRGFEALGPTTDAVTDAPSAGEFVPDVVEAICDMTARGVQVALPVDSLFIDAKLKGQTAQRDG